MDMAKRWYTAMIKLEFILYMVDKYEYAYLLLPRFGLHHSTSLESVYRFTQMSTTIGTIATQLYSSHDLEVIAL